jgi:ribonuclease HII
MRRWGFYRVAGCDEVGRGCLAGPVVAAASIVAKVTRDREMLAHHLADPRYGYDRHKGYATPYHLAAVAQHGYSALHRKSFRPSSLFDTVATRDS